MPRIYAQNPVITDNPSTNLSASSIGGTTSLSVYTNQGFSATTNLALLGSYSDEQAEIVKTSATATSSMTLSSGTIYPHPQDTIVTLMTYDQVEFSRSDDNGSTWTTLTLINLQVDRNSTVYIDTGGSATSQYRVRYFNSLTSLYSSYSSTITPAGFQPYQLENIQNRVVKLFPDPNLSILAYDEITDWANEALDDLAEAVYMADKMGLIGTISTTLSTNSFTLPDDFVRLKQLQVSYDGGVNYYRATPMDLSNSAFDGNQTTANSQFSPNQPIFYRQDNTVYILPNTPSNPTNYKLTYYRLPTYLSNSGDKLDLIFRPFSSTIVNYCLYRAKQKDKKTSEATQYFQIYGTQKQTFIESLPKWQFDQSDFIDSDDFNSLFGGMRTPGRL